MKNNNFNDAEKKLTSSQIQELNEVIFNLIEKELILNKKCKIGNFGTFYVKEYPARKFKDNINDKFVFKDKRLKIVFKANKKLEKLFNEG